MYVFLELMKSAGRRQRMADMPVEYPLPRGDRWAVWRWHDIPSQINKGQVYLRRLRVINTPWFGVMVHWINEPDTGRWPHDHPWNFYSWVLRGAVYEELYPNWRHYTTGAPPLQRVRRRWSVSCMRIREAHRIVLVPDGTMTLVITGKRQRKFCFWTPQHKISWDRMRPSEVNDVD